MKERGSGLLAHITSLPSPYGIGDFGGGAYRFVDFLNQTGQSYWQVLPLNPTGLAHGNSPYSSVSAFAVNVLLISPELLIKEELLTEEEAGRAKMEAGRVDYERVVESKLSLLEKACSRFSSRRKLKTGYSRFCEEEAGWLDDYALFVALKEKFELKPWNEWPQAARDREPTELEKLRSELAERIEKEKVFQFLAVKQWMELKQYCNQKGIQILGDIPIYVTYDSVDVWTSPELFKLDKDKRPRFLAGVPPDYFSKTGQLWGNPVYNWQVLKKQGYEWWLRRLEYNLKLFNLVRVDHFRGFVGYWEVPYGEETAINGRWEKTPAYDFFQKVTERFPELPIIAEDLGIITEDVKEVMKHFGFAGMKVLMFAFSEEKPDHPYLPHNYIHNCLAYTGTHDNNTALGWFEEEAGEPERERLAEYVGHDLIRREIHWTLIRTVMRSVADMVIFPLQDVLGLPAEHRMNVPGTGEGNWSWRFQPEQLTQEVSDTLGRMTYVYGRIPEKE